MWRMMKTTTGCARSAACDAGRGKSNHVDILRGVAQGCILSPNLFKACINDMIVAVEAAKQGVAMGEDTVSLMFADDFVGISEASEGLLEQIEKAQYERCSVSKGMRGHWSND